ncbi:MAG: transcription factor S [Candidatus Aenigmarchaeota archaeon]|nr:transcription factor S [Candidatus Aenigmarchaeota archaeon]
MEFCKCGGMLAPKGKNVVACRSCGSEIKKSLAASITESREKKDIVVIEDNRPDLPSTEKQCPVCGNDRAYWWLIQTRSADEPPTQFFRCTNGKCKHTWREYK